MAETFQVVGGAIACVDLAMKAYKEIERFRLRVKQADEVGEELASKYGRLMKTLDDVHGALKCRKDQLHGQTPAEGEARVWVNIHDSLIGMRKAMRAFKKELELLDQGRDVTKKRKWIDRAIWQMKLNKKAPVFDKLEEAANTRIDELTLSLFSMQIFMHTETTQYIQVLVDRMDSIEASLQKVSTTVRKNPAISAPPSRRSNKRQLQICLQVAHAIVDKRKHTPRVAEERRDSRVFVPLPEDSGASIWTDAESIFEQSASPRRGTLQLAPDQLPSHGAERDGSNRSPRTPLLEDFTDSSDDELDDLSDEDSDDASMSTENTNMDDINDYHERFETAQNSLSTTISRNTDRTGSVTSNYSHASCTGIDQRRVDPLMRALKAKDANTVHQVLGGNVDNDPARRVSITIQCIPILHMAILKEAGPSVIDALFKSSRVDVNAVEPEEMKSALHWAVKYNRQSCCARLLQAPDIDIEMQDKYEYTPLHSALHLSAHSDADVYTVVKLLLEAGAKIPPTLPRGMSTTVESLVKKHERRRRASGSSSMISGSDLAKARTTPAQRRSSDDASSMRRRLTFSLGRSSSTRN